jgi:hypothetical protein
MAQIGALTVDLVLKTAQFVADLDKTSKGVAKSATQMQRSFATVEKSVSAMTAGLAAFASARTIRQIIRVTDQSLLLAATMSGPLGKAAQKFLAQFEDLQNHFEIGLAVGFLNEVDAHLLNTQGNLKSTQDVGMKAGAALGAAFLGILQFIVDISDGVQESSRQLDALGKAVSDFANQPLPSWLSWVDTLNDDLAITINKALQLAGLSANLPTRADTQPLVTPDQSASGDAATSTVTKLAASYTTLADAVTLAAMDTTQFWNATVSTTAAGQALLETDQAHVALINQIGGPLEQYRLKILQIAQAHYTASDAARAQMNAQLTLADEGLKAASSVTGALAQLFQKNKGFAIANAVINTAEAITSALKNPPGPPFSYAYAAAAALTGAAQIAAITSAQPGNAKVPTVKGAAAVSAGSGGGGGGGSTSQQAVTIHLEGGPMFTKEAVRGLITQIGEAVGDGARLRVA